MSEEVDQPIGTEVEIANRDYAITLKEKLASVPSVPGCYIMKDARGQIIYIGKARVLRNRVRQYFQPSTDHTSRIRRMVFEVADLNWIITDSELEALILESNLIKKHHPEYNVRLRDDKSYPYIVLTMSEKWPRPVFVRKLRLQANETDKYFGPYTDSDAVKETLRLIRRIFKVPCGYKDPDKAGGKPCMYYHINQCLGPCAGKTSTEAYMSTIRDVISFIEGRDDELVDRLIREMGEAAENLEFEKAARYRDQVAAIQKLIARQKVVSTALQDQDVIALVTDNLNTCAELFFIRGGKLIGQEHFLLDNVDSEDFPTSLQEFLMQYYQTAPYIPREVLLSNEIAELDIVESWLRQKKGRKVQIASPKRGEKKGIVDMAKTNAEQVLRQIRLKMESDNSRRSEELEGLQNALNLPKPPVRIEAYDISNTGGHQTVASLVVFENGSPHKDHYRKFKLKQPEGVPDDFASMKQVILRRLTGTLRKSAAFEHLPDLILVDGGKGQLSAGVEALMEANERVSIIGLAKRNEEIYRVGSPDPVMLPRDSKALHLLQRIRDEAHRFAITYHKAIRGKSVRGSTLNEIPGIGPRRRRALLSFFGGVEHIKEATVDQIASVPTMSRPAAEAVWKFFHRKS